MKLTDFFVSGHLTVALASSYHWMQSEIVHETRLIGDHALAARFSLTVNDIV